MPQVLTSYTMWEFYRNTTGATGTARFTRYIKQQGGQDAVRVNYASDNRLDSYMDVAANSPEGVLSELDIEALCGEFEQPDLLQPLLELRRRHMRATAVVHEDYALLPSETPDR